MPQPDFSNLQKVLDRKKPDRPTLFEFFLNGPLYERLAGPEIAAKERGQDFSSLTDTKIRAFQNAGYDYVQAIGCDIHFNRTEPEHKETISLNALSEITDRTSFKSHPWPDPDSYDYSRLDDAHSRLPAGMKVIVSGPGGVLENAISLVGFERLCIMLADDAILAGDVFAAIGQTLVRYYQICGRYECVGAMISNDDWGFKTQTMLSPADMRKYVIPWHKRIVSAIHQTGRPAILHSCGKLDEVMPDIVHDIGYDAKHSYEDIIEPVEKFYDRMAGKIAVLGGIDLDFTCRSSEEQITERCKRMLAKAEKKGAYALGTGNSVPEYIPQQKYFAMINAVLCDRQ